MSKTNHAPYKQVFIGYGPHNNIKLLIEYGFVLQKNYCNLITFTKGEQEI
jgi:hypothetical protein